MWGRAGACALVALLLTGCTHDLEGFVVASPSWGDEGGGAAGGDSTSSAVETSSTTGAGASGSSGAQSSSGVGGAAPDSGKCPGPVIDLVYGLPQTLSGDTTGASNDVGDSSCGGTQSGEVVYQIHVLTAGHFWAEADAAHQVLVYVREGCPGTTVHEACGTTSPGPSELDLYVDWGETFFLFVDGYGTTPQEGPFTLTLEID